ncbi:MAG: peptidyl-prolyl cis-trans isomerase [Holosporales bacterium]|jgi:peptidyl-prolyl cis-trans isomerase C|nr:peptidyl-prolyl cis-trans isomerase [Holosporales bacterium]
MNFYRLLFVSCAVVCCESGCEDSSKKQPTKLASGKEAAQEAAQTSQPPVVEEKAIDAPVSAGAPSSTSVENPQGKSNAPDKADVAATFSDGSHILRSDVMNRIERLPARARNLAFNQLYNLILFVTIQEKVAYEAAKKEGFEKKDQVAKSIALIEDGIAQQAYLDEKVKDKITPEAIKAQYDKLLKNFKVEDEYGLRHILVKTKEEALRIIEALKKGESFDTLQGKHSIDRKTLARQGFLGFFRASQLPQAEQDAITSTAVGGFVGVPVLVPQTGYSVLLVSEKRMSTPAPLDKVEDRIKSILSKRFALYHVANLCKERGVVFYAPDGSVVPVKEVDAKLEELRAKQQDPKKQSTAQEIKLEADINNLKETSVVAKIGDRSVVFKELAAFIKDNAAMFKGMPVSDVYNAASEEYVHRIVLKDAAAKSGIGARADVKEKQLEAIKAFLAREYLLDASGKSVTDAQVRDFYERSVARIDKNEMEYRLRVIPVESAEHGKKAIAKLKGGTSFEAVMEEFCADKRVQDQNGDLGYLKKDELTRLSSDLLEQVKKAPKATILLNTVDINGQLWVVRIEDKRPIHIPTFAESKEYLKQNIIQEQTVKVAQGLMVQAGCNAFGVDGKNVDFSSDETLSEMLGDGGIR